MLAVIPILAILIVALVAPLLANPVLNFLDHTTLIKEIPNAKLYKTSAVAQETGQDFNLSIIHLWGSNYYEMGYAHGRLLWDVIDEYNAVIPKWFELVNLGKAASNSALPKDIQDLLNTASGPDIQVAVLTALDWIYTFQFPHIEAAPVGFDDEVRGAAEGYCYELRARGKACLNEDAYKHMRALQMFPELIRMGCTITQSWGIAHAKNGKDTAAPSPKCSDGSKRSDKEIYADMAESMNGLPQLRDLQQAMRQTSFTAAGIEPGQDLIQSRLLDFGATPLINYQSLFVRHFDGFHNQKIQSRPFYSLGFPGTPSVITSGSDILAQSQKVFLDFIDRQDGSSHAPTGTQPHEATESERREAFVAQYVTEDELSYSRGDILTANLRAIPKATRQASISALHSALSTSTSASVFTSSHLASRRTFLLRKINSPLFHGAANQDVNNWAQLLANPPQALRNSRSRSASNPSLSDFRPGTYDGLSAIFSIRVQIEKSQGLDSLIDLTNNISRTWPIFLGYGASLRAPATHTTKIDGISTPALILTHEPSIRYWRDETISTITEKPTLNNIIMVDKRPQPSPADAILFPLFQHKYGDITLDWLLQTICQTTQSADVHGVWYDHNTHSAYISVGKLDDSWDYGKHGKAHQRPWMRFDWDILFAERSPAASNGD